MKQMKFLALLGLSIALSDCSSPLVGPPVRETFPQKMYSWDNAKDGDTIRFVRIGHASTLINVGGKYILTDPWFSETKGYYHGEPIAFLQEKLPKLTMVIVSHDHYDHFDLETFKSYPDKTVPFVVQ